MAQLPDYSTAFNGLNEHIAFALFKNLGSPRALTCWMLYKYGEHDQLVKLDAPDPLLYEDAGSYLIDYQATLAYRKCEFLGTTVDKRDLAAQKLAASERKCASTNQRILDRNSSWDAAALDRHDVIKRKISRILGSLDLDELHDHFGWGPGATATLPRKMATPVDKLLTKHISVTASAFQTARSVIGRDLHWLRARGIDADGPCSLLECEFEIVNANKVTFVPKDARCDRSIAMEPTANLFLQKGIGALIRKRLRRVGVDLNDQSKNQHLAKVGSLGSLATLDLSAASDSVSYQLVSSLVPDDWWLWLSRTRSAYSDLDGAVTRNEKFSSMGNGFTFELESLLFYAICKSVAQFVSVYGDDIVCDTESVEAVTEALQFYGFDLNKSKSFSAGHFRESCGSHYFKGIDVKPIYITVDPSGSAGDYHHLCNSLLHSRETHRWHLASAAYTAARECIIACAVGKFLSVYNGESISYRDTRQRAVMKLRNGDCTLPTGIAYNRSDEVILKNASYARDEHGANGHEGVTLRGLQLRQETEVLPWAEAYYAYTMRFRPVTPISNGFAKYGGARYVEKRVVHRHA